LILPKAKPANTASGGIQLKKSAKNKNRGRTQRVCHDLTYQRQRLDAADKYSINWFRQRQNLQNNRGAVIHFL